MAVRHEHRSDKTPLGRALYGPLHLPHTPKEGTDVLSPPRHRMDTDSPHPLAPLKHTASDGLGPVELGYGAGALLCADRGQRVPGDVAASQRRRRASAVARVLL